MNMLSISTLQSFFLFLLFSAATAIPLTPPPPTRPNLPHKPTSVPSPTHLYLHTNPHPPDPLGVTHVSGFYGPGAWTGWLLCTIASWYRLSTSPRNRIDPNLVLSLLILNWAGIDFFRQWHAASTHSFPDASMASLAAPTSLLAWGNLHGIAQLLTVVYLGANDETYAEHTLWSSTRFRVLTLGLVVPCLAQSVFAWSIAARGLDSDDARTATDITDRLPSLYWCGQESSVRLLGFWLHYLGFCYMANVASLAVGWFIYILHNHGPRSLRRLTHILLLGRIERLLVTWIFSGGAFSFMTGLSEIWWPHTSMRKVFIASLLANWLIFLLISIPSCALFAVFAFGLAIWYVMLAVTTGFKIVSQSCFFMPCAPQLIPEWDQLFSLVGGLVMLFGVEIGPDVIRRIRKRLRDEQGRERRIWEILRERIGDRVSLSRTF